MASIEDNAKAIKHLLIDKNLKAGQVATGMGKSKQFLSSLINPHQFAKRQEEVIAYLRKQK